MVRTFVLAQNFLYIRELMPIRYHTSVKNVEKPFLGSHTLHFTNYIISGRNLINMKNVNALLYYGP